MTLLEKLKAGGRKGGLKTSKAKRLAAIRNGKKGGASKHKRNVKRSKQ